MPAATATAAVPIRAGGFTLVEILVVMAVLALLVVMFAQLMNSAAAGVSQGTRRIEDDNEARLVLDRLAADFAGMLRRDDVDYSFARRTGDDFLSFYTQTEPGKPPGGAPANGVQRTAALLGVRLNADAASANYGRLERAAVNLSPAGLVFAPTRDGVNTPLLAPPNSLPPVADAEYHLFGSRVFRFEICFLSRDPANGTVRLLATLPANAARASLQSLVVAVAVLDEASRRVVTPGQLASLRAALADYADADAGNNRDIAAVWGDAVNSAGFAPDVPRPIRQAVRIYQRYYPLP